MIHPKVLFGALESGSWSNEELSAVYFGGILASSRTTIPRDDRGAAFVELVKGLSVYDMRLHFIVYRAIYELLSGWKLNLGMLPDRSYMRIYFPDAGMHHAMGFEEAEDGGTILSHSVSTLLARGLLEHYEAVGPAEILRRVWPAAPEGDGFVLGPSAVGVELFLWVHGFGGMPVQAFTHPRLKLNLEPNIPPAVGCCRTIPDGFKVPWALNEAWRHFGPAPLPESPTDS